MTRVIPSTGDVRRLAHPGTAASQARDNPAPTILLIFVALVAVQSFRTGALPTPRQAATYVGAGLAFALLATVAPDLVTYSLLLVLLFVFLTNAAVIETAIERFTSSLGTIGQVNASAVPPVTGRQSVGGPQGGIA